jgi:hypothetical protein
MITAAALAGCSSSNIADVKAHAAETWKQAGFEIVGYEGWERGPYLGGDDGGAYVWYTLKRIPDNGITYHGSIQRWGDEYHIYRLSALDAIKPERGQ